MKVVEYTEREYQEKKKQVIDRFSSTFIKDYYNNDAKLNMIIEMLIRGENPYLLLEKVIIQMKENQTKFAEICKHY